MIPRTTDELGPQLKSDLIDLKMSVIPVKIQIQTKTKGR